MGGQYGDVISELVAEGFNVYTMDWRSQGLSGRLLLDPQVRQDAAVVISVRVTNKCEMPMVYYTLTSLCFCPLSRSRRCLIVDRKIARTVIGLPCE